MRHLAWVVALAACTAPSAEPDARPIDASEVEADVGPDAGLDATEELDAPAAPDVPRDAPTVRDAGYACSPAEPGVEPPA
jgi:hypothetical protein